MNRRNSRIAVLAIFAALIAIDGFVVFAIWCPATLDLERHGILSPDGLFPGVAGPSRCWLMFGKAVGILVAAYVGGTLFSWLYRRWPSHLTNGLLVMSLALTTVGAVGQFGLLAAGLGSLALWAIMRFGRRRTGLPT